MNANPRVSEFMNRTLVYVQEGDRPEIALRPILDAGITAVPVLDREHRPVGMISLRDLADPRKKGARITQPVSEISASATVATAGAIMAETGYHHLVVTDENGVAIGVISSLDVLRAFAGMSPRHPAKLTRLARATQDPS